MKSDGTMRHLISLREQSREDLLAILQLARMLKAKRMAGQPSEYLSQKTLIMLFQKTSTRTRLSFETAMTELGGHAIFLDARTTQFALTDFKTEIQAIMRFGHLLVFRARRSADVAFAASCNRIPVIDACSEKYHPAQALGDVLTMLEYSGSIHRIKKVAWLGIENNVSNSLMLACVKLGISFVLVSPEVDPESVDRELTVEAEATGLVIRTLDMAYALHNADYVHTDTWMNMEFFEDGHVKEEWREEYERRKKVFQPFQLNAALIDAYAPHARIMHCMPCHVGYEITHDALYHPRSIIFDQAENRLHVQKAILAWLLCGY